MRKARFYFRIVDFIFSSSNLSKIVHELNFPILYFSAVELFEVDVDGGESGGESARNYFDSFSDIKIN